MTRPRGPMPAPAAPAPRKRLGETSGPEKQEAPGARPEPEQRKMPQQPRSEPAPAEIRQDSEPTPEEQVQAAFGGAPVELDDPPTEKSQQAALSEASDRRSRINDGYKASFKKDNPFVGENAKRTDKERLAQMATRHDQYTHLMALNCVRSLGQGIDARTIASVATTAAVMWCLSPRFRDLMRDYNDKLNEGLGLHRSDVADKLKKVPFGSSRRKTEAAQAKAAKVDADFQNRMSLISTREDRVPHSLDSAARELMQVNEAAYDAVRMGEPYQQVREQFDSLVQGLGEQWKEDGLNPNEVYTCFRDLVGEEMAKDPAAGAKYLETGYGFVRPSRQGMVRAADGSTVPGWNRHWQLDSGALLDDSASGPFVFRGPMTLVEHQQGLVRLVSQDLASASRGGPEALAATLSGYMGAWDAKDALLGSDGTGGTPADPALAASHRARAAMQAMLDDGIGPDLRKEVFEAAVGSGVAEFGQNNPDAVAAFDKKYPKGIDDQVSAFVERVKEQGRDAPLLAEVHDPSNPGQRELEDRAGVARTRPEAARPEPAPTVGQADGSWGPRVDSSTEKQLAQAQAARQAPKKTAMERSAPPQPQHQKESKASTLGKQGRPQAERKQTPVYRLLSEKDNAKREAAGYGRVDKIMAGDPVVPTSAEHDQQMRDKVAAAEASTGRKPSADSEAEAARRADERNHARVIKIPEEIRRRYPQTQGPRPDPHPSARPKEPFVPPKPSISDPRDHARVFEIPQELRQRGQGPSPQARPVQQQSDEAARRRAQVRRNAAAANADANSGAPQQQGTAAGPQGERQAQTKGGEDWRRRSQNQAAARHGAVPRMPGSGAATVGQRHQAEAHNSAYGTTKQMKIKTSWDDPSTTVVESKGQSSGAGRALGVERANDVKGQDSQDKGKEGPEL